MTTVHQKIINYIRDSLSSCSISESFEDSFASRSSCDPLLSLWLVLVVSESLSSSFCFCERLSVFLNVSSLDIIFPVTPGISWC